MKKILLAVIFLPCIELFSGEKDTILDPASDISYCAELDNSSRYIFRGIILNRNFVVQPAISGSYKNFSAGIWGNINTNSAESPAGMDEVDLFAAYEFILSDIKISNNAAMYIFSGQSAYPTTTEYMLKASYYSGPVCYSTELAVDIMEYPGAFVVTNCINYENAITENLYLNASVSLSWAGSKYNEVNAGLRKTAFNYAGIDLYVTYYLKNGIYLKPHIQYNRLIDKELGEYIDVNTSSFGVLLGYTF